MQLRTTQADALVFSKAGLFGVPKMYDLSGLGSKGQADHLLLGARRLIQYPCRPTASSGDTG